MSLWVKQNHGAEISASLTGTPFSLDIACAIACQETGLYLVQFIDTLTSADALARCVFDASGDYPGTSRSAFPKNTGAFRDRYGDEFTDMLISEANATRHLRGFSPAKWVYKGYGIFQYDLQSVKSDRAFFEQKLWYRFPECLARLRSELVEKYSSTHDVMLAIRAYNGSGPAADRYLENVRQFIQFASEV